MPFAAALSTETDSLRALDDICTRAQAQLQVPAQLGLLFFSPHHVPSATALAERARKNLPNCRILGCAGESIVGNDQEIMHAGAWPTTW